MKICLVCSSGGHIIEMQKVAEAFNSSETFLITHKDKVLNWKSDIKKIYFIKNALIGKTEYNIIYKLIYLISYIFIVSFNEAKIILQERPEIIISTGSAIAVPIFYIGKLFRIKLVYIESLCRVDDISKAGKLVYPISDLFLVQWRDLTRKYPKSKYKGSILFNSYINDKNEKNDFIFVTVGSNPFPRLIKKVDEIIAKTGQQAIMQIGRTNYRPNNARYFDFIDDFCYIQNLYRCAKVVITHSGAGSIITALEQGANIIAVPRLKKYGESFDDHQLELPRALASKNYLTYIDNLEELEDIITNINKISVAHLDNQKKLIEFLKDYINIGDNHD